MSIGVGSFRQRLIRVGVLAALIAVAGVAESSAQTAFTAQVTERAHVDLSFNFIGSLARHTDGGFEWYAPQVTVGLGSGLEVGVGSSTMVSDATAADWMPHVAWQVYSRPALALTVGTEWHLPTGLARADRYGLLYVAAGHSFGEHHPLYVDAGIYALVDQVPSGNQRQGVSIGLRRELEHGWSLAGGWTSGDNFYGYLSSGLSLETGGNLLFVGYCVGNNPSANHGPCISTRRSF